MENASKALIIAGAILLSILIIALGMSVYNSSKSASANADLSATEISSFNSTFESYEGSQKGSSVRTLITAVISSNQKNTDKLINIKDAATDANKKIHVSTNSNGYVATADKASGKAAIQIVQADIVSNKTYKVEFTYDNTGLITDVNITQ